MNILPPELVELVRLIHWEGFTIAEASTLVDIPPSTARTRYAKARQLLKQELSAHATASTNQ